jgi:hypothetical protein
VNAEEQPPSGKGGCPESLADGLDASPNGTADIELAARARRHDHGVLVLAERQDGVVVSQVFADLPAAERKVQRTRDRGLSATLTLVRLVPLPHVTPEALDALGGGR